MSSSSDDDDSSSRSSIDSDEKSERSSDSETNTSSSSEREDSDSGDKNAKKSAHRPAATVTKKSAGVGSFSVNKVPTTTKTATSRTFPADSNVPIPSARARPQPEKNKPVSDDPKYDPYKDPQLEQKEKTLTLMSHAANCRLPAAKCTNQFCKASKMMLQHIMACKIPHDSKEKCKEEYCSSAKFVLKNGPQIKKAAAEIKEKRANKKRIGNNNPYNRHKKRRRPYEHKPPEFVSVCKSLHQAQQHRPLNHKKRNQALKHHHKLMPTLKESKYENASTTSVDMIEEDVSIVTSSSNSDSDSSTSSSSSSSFSDSDSSSDSDDEAATSRELFHKVDKEEHNFNETSFLNTIQKQRERRQRRRSSLVNEAKVAGTYSTSVLQDKTILTSAKESVTPTTITNEATSTRRTNIKDKNCQSGVHRDEGSRKNGVSKTMGKSKSSTDEISDKKGSGRDKTTSAVQEKKARGPSSKLVRDYPNTSSGNSRSSNSSSSSSSSSSEDSSLDNSSESSTSDKKGRKKDTRKRATAGAAVSRQNKAIDGPSWVETKSKSTTKESGTGTGLTKSTKASTKPSKSTKASSAKPSKSTKASSAKPSNDVGWVSLNVTSVDMTSRMKKWTTTENKSKDNNNQKIWVPPDISALISGGVHDHGEVNNNKDVTSDLHDKTVEWQSIDEIQRRVGPSTSNTHKGLYSGLTDDAGNAIPKRRVQDKKEKPSIQTPTSKAPTSKLSHVSSDSDSSSVLSDSSSQSDDSEDEKCSKHIFRQKNLSSSSDTQLKENPDIQEEDKSGGLITAATVSNIEATSVLESTIQEKKKETDIVKAKGASIFDWKKTNDTSATTKEDRLELSDSSSSESDKRFKFSWDDSSSSDESDSDGGNSAPARMNKTNSSASSMPSQKVDAVAVSEQAPKAADPIAANAACSEAQAPASDKKSVEDIIAQWAIAQRSGAMFGSVIRPTGTPDSDETHRKKALPTPDKHPEKKRDAVNDKNEKKTSKQHLSGHPKVASSSLPANIDLTSQPCASLSSTSAGQASRNNAQKMSTTVGKNNGAFRPMKSSPDHFQQNHIKGRLQTFGNSVHDRGDVLASTISVTKTKSAFEVWKSRDRTVQKGISPDTPAHPMNYKQGNNRPFLSFPSEPTGPEDARRGPSSTTGGDWWDVGSVDPAMMVLDDECWNAVVEGTSDKVNTLVDSKKTKGDSKEHLKPMTSTATKPAQESTSRQLTKSSKESQHKKIKESSNTNPATKSSQEGKDWWVLDNGDDWWCIGGSDALEKIVMEALFGPDN